MPILSYDNIIIVYHIFLLISSYSFHYYSILISWMIFLTIFNHISSTLQKNIRTSPILRSISIYQCMYTYIRTYIYRSSYRFSDICFCFTKDYHISADLSDQIYFKYPNQDPNILIFTIWKQEASKLGLLGLARWMIWFGW